MHRPTTLLLASIVLVVAAALLPGARAGDESPGWGHPDVLAGPMVLPQVVKGTVEVADAPVFLVNVDANGVLLYAQGEGLAASAKSRWTPLAKGTLTPGDEVANVRTLSKLGAAMQRAAAAPTPRDGDGTSRRRLFVRASRHAPWAYVLWLLMKGAEPRVGMTRILFAVEGPERAVLGHDLPGDRRRPASSEVVRRVVRIDLGTADATGLLDRTLADLERDDVDRTVELALTPAGERTVTTGDVLPLLAAVQAAGHEVHLIGVPLGRLAGPEGKVEPVPAPSLRGRFLTAPPRRTSSRREEARDKAILKALDWLAAHQAPSGGWEAQTFANWCDGKRVPAARRPQGAGKPEYDRGVTGLALLAFLGAGYTHRGKHAYAETVLNGLEYLKARQDTEGCFSVRDARQYIYDHGAAAWAMVEAYGMTGSSMLRASAQKALDFIAIARNPYYAWRYGIKPGDNDTSVTAWMYMPLAAARIVNDAAKARDQPAPLTIDEEASDGVRAWLEKMTDPDYGRVGYIQRGGGPARQQDLIDRYPADRSESMTGVGITLKAFLGIDPTRDPLVRKGVKLMEKLPPTWNATNGSLDMYYWYWGTMALHQVGGRAWTRWWMAVDEQVVPNQRKDTTRCLYLGSWDPVGPWGREGGRVYSTALCCLVLETPLRYDRLHAR